MSHIIADRVKETTTTVGTGQITLDGAVTGFASFNDKMVNADTCFYCIDGGATGQWEVGLGDYSDTNLLTRTSVLSNSLGTTSLVDFSTGVKDVFMTHPAASLQRVKSGTYNATVLGGTSAGTCTYTYGNAAYYVRTGDLVYVHCPSTEYTSHTGTGAMILGGLPYAFKQYTGGPIPVYLRDITFANSSIYGWAYTGVSGVKQFKLVYNVTNASPTELQMDAAGAYAYSFTYITNDPF